MPTALFVVSPHGFGHAARSCAVIEALAALVPALRVEIATTAPEWFFADALPAAVERRHRPVEVDVGLVQRTPFDEDLEATRARLEQVVGRHGEGVRRLDTVLADVRPAVVVADIAPLGPALARRRRVPSVLVENFTWEFIYRAYGPALDGWAARLGEMSRFADLRIQTEPWCEAAADAVHVAPVARRPRASAAEVRRRLGLGDGRPLVLVSMGGVPWAPRHLDRLRRVTAASLVVPGCDPSVAAGGALVPLPMRSPLYHPDLVAAADLVVGKLGYSTVAEAWTAGVPYAFVPRDRFPESAVVAGWVEREMPSARLTRSELESGDWLDRLDELLALPRGPQRTDGGAGAAAAAIAAVMGIGV